MTITYKQWGHYHDQEVYLFDLVNDGGARVQLTNYGATIVSVQAPDRDGNLGEVVLGFNTLEGFLRDKCYLGSTIGRVANRIGGAAFNIGDQAYQLEANDGANNNHSGSTGLHAKVFDFEVLENALIFRYSSPDGEGGFPGRLKVTVLYQWTVDHRLEITYEAITDRDTVVNLTNHAYFNLSGANGTMLDHTLAIPASRLLEADSAYIPTGIVAPAGLKALQPGKEIGEIIRQVAGLNDYYILDDGAWEIRDGLRLAAMLSHTPSGRNLFVYTTYPGLMVYTADYLASETPGLLGELYQPFYGICLECQHYPDAPHHAGFPSVLLRPGQQYHEKIVYHFGQYITTP